MKNKSPFIVILILGLFFLVFTIPLVQASLIENVWYNTLTFLGIIKITNANHLNSDKVVISDVYNEVKELDDIWSEQIPDGDYVRVTFEKKLTNKNDITIYPRIVSGNPKIEVYEKDKNEKITEFTDINSNQYNRVFLTNLVGEQETFDLKIVDGSVEFEHVIDPLTQGNIVGAQYTSANPTINLDTTDNPELIIVQITSINGADVTAISTVADGAFTEASGSIGSGPRMETWYKTNPTAEASKTISITGGDLGFLVAIGIQDANTTTPMGNVTSTTGTTAQADNVITTTAANSMIYSVWGHQWNNNPTNGAGQSEVYAGQQGGATKYAFEVTNETIAGSGTEDTQSFIQAKAGVSWALQSVEILLAVAPDTCTCPGLNQNWEIDMGDSCNIVDACNLGTGNITFIGTGTTTFNAAISTANLEYPTTDQILNIGSNAIITIG